MPPEIIPLAIPQLAESTCTADAFMVTLTASSTLNTPIAAVHPKLSVTTTL